MPNDIAKLRRIMRQANKMVNQHPANGDRSYAMRAARGIDDIKEPLLNGFARFVYKKEDGTERSALGTLSSLLIPTDKLPKSNGENTDKSRHGLITYYDLDKQGWRSFYFYSFIRFDNSWPFNDPLTPNP